MSNFTKPVSTAVLHLYVELLPSKQVRAHIYSNVPGCTEYKDVMACSTESLEEISTVYDWFHNEWRSWGMIMDQVVDDFTSNQLSIF